MTALGAALYHDFAIGDDTDPLEALLVDLFDDERGLTQFCIPVDRRKQRPSAYRREHLLDRVRAGELRSFVVGSPGGVADDEAVALGINLVPTTPAAEGGYAGYRYRADLAVGASRLQRRGADAFVKPLLRLADAIDPRAGVVLAAASASYAHALASGAGGDLTPDQSARVKEVYYAVYELKGRIRGPEWGTLLDSHHVDRLGGVDRIGAESGCAVVRPLAHGGVYLQLTETLPDPDDGALREQLARLAAYLAPLTTTP